MAANQNLFTLENIQVMCQMDESVRKHRSFSETCVRSTHSRGCCKSWSLPNYVALISNRSTCHNITRHDVTKVLELLQKCANYYHKMILLPDCDGSDIEDTGINQCNEIPTQCKRHNAVYNILHYITDVEFMKKRSHSGGDTLRYAMTLLPIAAGSAAEPLYWRIMERHHHRAVVSTVEEPEVEIYAINFGIKHMLFDYYLKKDMAWFCLAVVVLLCAMWLYSTSLFITVIAALTIFLALEIAYFLYTLIFEIRFFPFMNLLAIVILVGIGFDDIFIYCKVWSLAKSEKNIGTLEKIISDSLKHALLSMLVTSFTTAGAFYASVVSNITSLKCFSIFAGTAVVVNYTLMITLIPATMVIYEKWSSECTSCTSTYKITAKSPLLNCLCRLPFRFYYAATEWARVLFDKILPCIVVRVRYFWLVLFGAVAVFGTIVIFYHPRLKLPSSNEFQVFSLDHPFEVYDFIIKDVFWFEKAAGASNPTMPLTIVWGVHPRDNGNKLDPYSTVTLDYDSAFNVTSPEAQQWLLDFCRSLRSTEMYQRSSGPQLTNCFIENFRRFMERGCEGLNGENYSPCCKASSFPYDSTVFQQCIRVYRPVLAQTRALYFSNNQAGLRYSRETGNILGLIVEFNSKHPFSFSYKSMKKFYDYMEKWSTEQFQKAPAGMQMGWFISHLEFYDLQDSIAQGTPVAIGVAIAIATAIAFITTLNVLITIHAMLSIMGSIFTTVGILVMLGWELDILESVTINIAVGLSIDFTLHYAMAYRLSPHSDRELRVVTSLSRMGTPVAMAAGTTFLAGAIMMPSTVLAYKKLGTFLMIIMAMSWAFATVFFQALLRTLGPPGGFGQFNWPTFDCCTEGQQDHVDKTIYTMSESTLSSVGTHGNSNEMHELEPLTERLENHRNAYRHPKPTRYQHRLSIASSSSGSESSPISRRDSELSSGNFRSNDSPSGTRRLSGSTSLLSSPAQRTRGSTSSLQSAKNSVGSGILSGSTVVDGDSVFKKATSSSSSSPPSTAAHLSKDAGHSYPATNNNNHKKETIVTLENPGDLHHSNRSSSKPSVHLIRDSTTSAPERREGTNTAVIAAATDEDIESINSSESHHHHHDFSKTDSNSNRTDLSADKHAVERTPPDGVWIKQTVPAQL